MTDPLLLDTAMSLFSDKCSAEAVQAAEGQGWAPQLWDALAEVGFPWLGLPESLGGAGGSTADALAVLRIAGRFAAPVPLAETSLLAGWLLAGAGLPVGKDPITVAPGRPDDSLLQTGNTLNGVVHRVPWARQAKRIVLLVPASEGWQVATVQPEKAKIEPLTNLAGEPRDTVVFDRTEILELAPAAPGMTPDTLLFRGALSRAMLMAGALERMSEMTIKYTNERRQFGRPVAAFQGVQIHLVNGAQDAALVNMAAEQAARVADQASATFEIASAKILASQAAQTATKAAHQAHGAMGMTQEYPLHHFSRRLWAWRSEYGDERFWSVRLGRAISGAGSGALYPAITGGSAVIAL